MVKVLLTVFATTEGSQPTMSGNAAEGTVKGFLPTHTRRTVFYSRLVGVSKTDPAEKSNTFSNPNKGRKSCT